MNHIGVPCLEFATESLLTLLTTYRNGQVTCANLELLRGLRLFGTPKIMGSQGYQRRITSFNPSAASASAILTGQTFAAKGI